MADPIRSSLRAMRRLRGRQVTFRRGSLEVPLIAVPGQTRQDISDGYGAATVHRFEDWIIERSDLAGTDGKQLTPLVGDEILRETPTGQAIYQVAEPDQNTPAWRAVDTDGYWIRIHTQYIGAT